MCPQTPLTNVSCKSLRSIPVQYECENSLIKASSVSTLMPLTDDNLSLASPDWIWHWSGSHDRAQYGMNIVTEYCFWDCFCLSCWLWSLIWILNENITVFKAWKFVLLLMHFDALPLQNKTCREILWKLDIFSNHFLLYSSGLEYESFFGCVWNSYKPFFV